MIIIFRFGNTGLGEKFIERKVDLLNAYGSVQEDKPQTHGLIDGSLLTRCDQISALVSAMLLTDWLGSLLAKRLD